MDWSKIISRPVKIWKRLPRVRPIRASAFQSDVSPEVGRAIFTSTVEHLFEQIRTACAVNLLLTSLFVATLWGEVPGIWVPLWGGGLIAVNIVRLVMARAYDRASEPDPHVWVRRYVVGLAASSALWGLSVPLFFGVVPALKGAAVAIGVGGVAAGGLPLTAAILPVYLMHVGLTLIPPIVGFAVLGDPTHILLAFMTVIFSAALVAAGRAYSRNLHDAHRFAERLGFANRALAQQLDIHTRFYENLPVPLYRATSGATGRFIRFNTAFMGLLEADRPEQLYECNISDLYVDPDNRQRVSEEVVHAGEIHAYEIELRTLRGRVIHCLDTAYRLEDENGRIVFDGALMDVTRQRELESDLSRQARFDELTDLANRRHCEAALTTEIARAERDTESFSLLMLDVDHFKQINDACGHAEGDAVLQRVAQVIRENVRQTDLAGRWGGEEFLILLPSTPETGAADFAEKLRQAISATTHADGTVVTVSIGYGQYTAGEGRDALIERVDNAMYAAKDNGRDCICSCRHYGQWPEE